MISLPLVRCDDDHVFTVLGAGKKQLGGSPLDWAETPSSSQRQTASIRVRAARIYFF